MNPLESNSLDSSVSYKLSNDFSTVKVNDIENVIAADRVQPRQVSTGVTRGTWRVVSNDGSYITVGLIPETNDEFGIAYWNSNGDLISKNDGTTETRYDTNGVPRIFTGSDPSTGGFIMKISEPNIDVLTATNDQLIFNSDQNVFKIVKEITGGWPEVFVTGPGVDGFVFNSGTTVVAHGLTGVPAFLAFADFKGDGSRTNLPITITSVSDPRYYLQGTISVTTDATNVTFTAEVLARLPAGVTVSFEAIANACKVFLMQETAS